MTTDFRHTDDVIPADPNDKIAYPDAYLREILESVFKVATLGYHPDLESAAYTERLKGLGYHVIPVNPALAGEMHVSEVVPARISDIPTKVDMLQVFGGPEDALFAAEGAAAAKEASGLKVLWLEPGTWNPEAARVAEAAGLKVVMGLDAAEQAERLGVR
jgi:predicted CoA-binding protein